MTKQEEEKAEYNSLRIKLGIKVRSWTDRMLAALVNGVKGNKWFTLIDKINTKETMLIAWSLVEKNQGAPGIDKVTIEKFGAKYSRYLEEVIEAIKQGVYKPSLIKRVYIPKGNNKKDLRPLGIPCVKDRIVQAAIKLIIEPIFENEFIDTSYGFRPGRGCKDALRRVEANLNEGFTYVLDADLKSYFDTIPHDKLEKLIEDKIADSKVLDLIRGFLKQGILEDCKEWIPTQGCPQGSVLSPLFSNIFLHPLDKIMLEENIRMVRYADDFVIMCKSKEEAEKAFKIVEEWTKENGLILHPEKTHMGDCRIPGKGFEFLGYRFENGNRTVRKKSLNKLKDKIRSLTRRNNGNSLKYIISKLNPILRGWFEYFKQAHKWTFEGLDGFIRRRLRSVLKRYNKGRGLARTLKDHMKWPNKFFKEAGLISLQEMFKCAIQLAKVCQSR